MKNRIVLLGGLLFLGIVVVWLIRSEGQRFRDSADNVIRQTVGETAEKTIDKGGDKAGELIDKAADRSADLIDKAARAPGKIVADITQQVERTSESGSAQPTEPVPAPAAETGFKNAPQPEPTPASEPPSPQDLPNAGRGDSETTSKGEPAVPSAPAQPLEPIQLVADVFRWGQDVTKTVDDLGQRLLALSVEEEQAVGREVHNLMLKQQPLLNTHPVVRRLERLAEPILEKRARREIEYRFFVIEDDQVNAFSLLGGYIYVTTALLDLRPSDAELQFVLGHEIAHVDLKHCVRKLTYLTRANELAGEGAGDLVLLAYHSIAVGYSEEDEYEADAWACRWLIASGQTNRPALKFIKRFRQEAPEEIEDLDPAAGGVIDAGVRELKNHFRSHPPVAARVDRLEQISEPSPQ